MKKVETLKLAQIRARTPNPDFDCRQTAFAPDQEGKGILDSVKNLLARLCLRRTWEAEKEFKKPCKDQRTSVIEQAQDTNDFFFDEGRWGDEKKASDNGGGKNTGGTDLMLPNQ